jgi:hypothetical protein
MRARDGLAAFAQKVARDNVVSSDRADQTRQENAVKPMEGHLRQIRRWFVRCRVGSIASQYVLTTGVTGILMSGGFRMFTTRIRTNLTNGIFKIIALGIRGILTIGISGTRAVGIIVRH